MFSELLIMQSVIERGLIFSSCIIALYLTSRVIKFDDLSLEGSFGLGGATMALLLSKNIPWYYALLIVLFNGALSGLATGVLHTKLKLNNLMSGIVVMTGLFSVNLKIAGSNMIIGNKATIFSLLPDPHSMKLIILLPISVGILLITKWLLSTEYGFLFQAVGDNKQILINLGKNPSLYITATLMIANAITAFSGALFVQYIGYFSIWSSVGILIIALAGLFLSELFSKNLGPAIIIGSILYQAVISVTFELNVDPEWNKLITALLIVGMICLKQYTPLLQRKC